jgi:hypothetical protein
MVLRIGKRIVRLKTAEFCEALKNLTLRIGITNHEIWIEI